MKRRHFLRTAIGGTGAFLGQPGRTAQRPPNIILIMADDLGYECLGSNGAIDYRTPNVDRLAGEGVRFTNAHSTPLCTPTRVQLMTGKYNFRNYTEFGSLPPGEFTFAHLLREAGYKTCVVGKWQLAGRIEGAGYRGEGTLPRDAGFDEHCLWQVKHRDSRYWDPTIQINGELHERMKGEYGPDVFARYAAEFLERHRDRPVFLYYPMALTHDPFVPTPDSAGSSAERNKAQSDRAWFGDMVGYMDKIVGRIVAKVEQLGMSENTLILFTGDNGTHFSVTTQTKDGPYLGAKGQTTGAGTHVPLVARWQGLSPKGTVCGDLIDFTDFFPTLAEAAGAKIPGDHPKDGRSFLPQLKGERGDPRDWIFCHYEPKWGKFLRARWVMDKRWKLYDDGRFYDLQTDPGERQSKGELTAEMKRTKARFEAVLAKMQGNAG